MIKLEHAVIPSPEQMEFVIEGMRNPMNSWDKSDSHACWKDDTDCEYEDRQFECLNNCKTGGFVIGENDLSLMQKLSNAGTDHRKFMRMMPVMVRITAPLYWWKEFDTYKVGTVANSCSTMHKITETEFDFSDFSIEHLIDWEEDYTCKLLINEGYSPDGYPIGISPVGGFHVILALLNEARNKYIECEKELSEIKAMPEDEFYALTEKKKMYWWQMIQLLPSSYNQTRNVMLNYEVLANVYKSRRGHKLDEWRVFCEWIQSLPYSELITGGNK